MGNVVNYIYSGFIPLVKMGMTILAGFTLAKKGLFPPAASRGASHLSMTIGLPCLIFASVVPAFNSDNIKFLGPLCLSAIVYQASGFILGLIIRELFYVPVDFRYGIIIASTFSNWGNLPTAVVQTIATQDPFDPKRDPTLGVAYVSVFMLIYSLSFFGLGTCKICAWDFRPRPEGEVNVSRRVKWAERRQALGRIWAGMRETHHQTNRRRSSVESVTKPGQETDMDVDMEKKGFEGISNAGGTMEKGYVGTGNALEPSLSRYRSHQEIIAEAYHDGISLAPVGSNVSRATTTNGNRGRQIGDEAGTRGRGGVGATEVHHEKDEDEDETYPNVDVPGPQTKHQLNAVVHTHPPGPADPRRAADDEMTVNEARRPLWRSVISGVVGALNPVSISLFIALPIALVTPLKALFVVVEDWTGTKIPNGPDGKPPLSFILDTAAFIGAVCIPVGLMLLGASFARLKVPRPWSRLPIGAIIALMVSKMIIVPCIGVGMTQGLSQHTSLYPPDQKILKFVAMLLSGTPAAVNQLVITQIYSPDGSADTLSMFLIFQYIFMFVASAALAAVGLAFVA